MGKWLERFGGSIRFWILVAACVYFAYALYFAVYGLNFSIDLTHNQYVYNLVTKNSVWWQLLYYGSEGIAGSVAIILRALGASFAVYAAYLFWRNSADSTPQIRKYTSRALILEAGFFLALIPSTIAAFYYNLTPEYLFYFEHTPELVLLFGTAIPCLAIVLTVPPLLLKLRSTIIHKAPNHLLLKWGCLTGLAYLFVVFWFNYSMLWVANMVPYPRPNQLYGYYFLLQPTNLLSFSVTVFGLLAVSAVALITAMPAIKDHSTQLNLKRVGAVMIAFGVYFVFNTLFYTLTGGYDAHPSVWYEVIGPLHNPNLWAFAFIFVGMPLIIQGYIQKNPRAKS